MRTLASSCEPGQTALNLVLGELVRLALLCSEQLHQLGPHSLETLSVLLEELSSLIPRGFGPRGESSMSSVNGLVDRLLGGNGYLAMIFSVAGSITSSILAPLCSTVLPLITCEKGASSSLEATPMAIVV